MMVALCLIVIPPLAGLHRFSVTYGYKGWDRNVALADAINVFCALTVIEIVYAVWRGIL